MHNLDRWLKGGLGFAIVGGLALMLRGLWRWARSTEAWEVRLETGRGK